MPVRAHVIERLVVSAAEDGGGSIYEPPFSKPFVQYHPPHMVVFNGA